MRSFVAGLVVYTCTSICTLSSGIRFAIAEEGFRCKTGRLVSLGDRAYDVRNRCGDPDDETERTERRRVGVRVRSPLRPVDIEEHRYIDVTIQEWTYDSGRNRLIRVLSFENGRLIQVATSRRGNSKP